MTDNRPIQSTRNNIKNGLPPHQTVLLISLFALVVLILIGGLGYISQQEGYWDLIRETYTPTEPEDRPVLATVFTFQMPPTWTSMPKSTVPASDLMANPDNNGTCSYISTTGSANTSPPVISITPPANQWRIVIGRSVRNRPIEVIRFGTGKKERMVVAGIHGGNEWNTIALADALIAYLTFHPEFVPADTTLYILRSLNPDGEAVGRTPDGRANANGVDLNRNFEVNWKSSWKTEGCWSERPISAGSSPGSEPETQALMKFLLARNVGALVSYHSAGLGVFPSGDPPDPSSVRLAQTIAQVSGYQYPPFATGCEYTGSLVDWAQQHGVVAVDLELPTHTQIDFDKNLRILSLLLSWE